MRQETESIQQLEQRKKELSNKIGQRESLVSKIGTDKVWIGSSSEGGSLDQVLVGSSFEATLKVGQARKTVRWSIGGLKERLSQFDQEAEPKILQHAQNYLDTIGLKSNQLAEMSVLVAEGYLTEDVLRQHQQEFEEYARLPENPLLKRAIEKIREELKRREGPQTTDAKPSSTSPVEMETDGEETAETDRIPSSADTPEINRVDRLIQDLPEETESLFSDLVDSEDFRYAAGIVRHHIEQDGGIPHDLRSDLAGYFFEHIAYLHLRRELRGKNKIVLSPSDTFQIYYQLQPTKSRVSNRYGLQKGIEGVSVPDGMVLTILRGGRKVRIDGVCEYTVSPTDSDQKRERLTRSQHWFRENIRPLNNEKNPEAIGVMNYLRNRYPDLPSSILVNENVQAYVVFPLDLTMSSVNSGIHLIHVGITTNRFRNFIDEFVSDIANKQAIR